MIMGNIFNVPMEQTANKMSSNPICSSQMLERQILEQNTNILRSQQWLQCNWPNVRIASKITLMERQKFPNHVQEYIESNWIKVSDVGGGTYEEPAFHTSKKNGKTFPTRYGSFEDLPKLSDKDNKQNTFSKNPVNRLTPSTEEDDTVRFVFTNPTTREPMTYNEMCDLFSG